MSLRPFKRLKSISKSISNIFTEYFNSHFEGIDVKTEVGKKRMVLRSFFQWFKKFK